MSENDVKTLLKKGSLEINISDTDKDNLNSLRDKYKEVEAKQKRAKAILDQGDAPNGVYPLVSTVFHLDNNGVPDIEGAKDPKALLWKLYDALDKAGLAFDSDQVHEVAEGDSTISWKDMAKQMYKYKTDENYGLSDVQKWYDAQISLEE